jgi:hypothetical protein
MRPINWKSRVSHLNIVELKFVSISNYSEDQGEGGIYPKFLFVAAKVLREKENTLQEIKNPLIPKQDTLIG